MPVRTLYQITFVVDDLNKAVRFWKDGLKVHTQHTPGSNDANIFVGSAMFRLVQGTPPPPDKLPTIVVEVGDIRNMVRDLLKMRDILFCLNPPAGSNAPNHTVANIPDNEIEATLKTVVTKTDNGFKAVVSPEPIGTMIVVLFEPNTWPVV